MLTHVAKDQGHRVHEIVVSSAVELIFEEAAISTSSFHVTPRNGNDKKGEQSKSWPKSAGKGKSKEGNGDAKSKCKSKGSNSGKGSYKGRTSETQESAQTYHTDKIYADSFCFDDGWSDDEWNDDWSSVGLHEDWEQIFL